ncbi:SbcC/MukB-like Walker B domain-containing protein [Ralstonia pickettii]|uniref:SbcC/MukB-like Walker B domain-containing protein n=1 Tax=Ralstonia pickettii TaxID=329 RepID=UPI0015F7E2F0|nr:SbcC/MukB-like Walker B domain-containing protein [Ralstonia pickettii]MBB0026141.1 AAA family ATPase [Ralstonia pickettii]MBB0036802.1 AAA family ATPase [Ralstonia pickettii]MBB0099342.1 AAA family ATPase [Ralstonia pickettii]MBB0109137.1 AAA family ATPase [Ralstonia pickettii]MBB0130116.1 AAA family ATPase [Ralstonia pickettii]
MKLESLILVNWGSLRPGEYPMGNMTLLTGPTGSGKSTMLDALQTGMTAVYQHIFSYNPGQDETSQSTRNGKTKRTLWSYIVGAEDNLFARPDGAHGYVGLVFRPSEGETGKSFTALVAAAARVDGSGDRRQAVQERLALLIIDDAELNFDDLVALDVEGNMTVVEVERIESQLKARYPHVLNLKDNKREYLCQMYGRFRGQKVVSFQEAEAAAKAWTQAIAHKPIGSVDELVKTQILEYDPQQHAQRIGQISDLMRQVHGLRREGERLRESVARLETLGEVVRMAGESYEKAMVYQALLACRNLRDDERALEQANRAVDQLNGRLTEQNELIRQLRGEKGGYQEGLVTIKAKLSGIPAANQKERLDDRAAQAQKSLTAALGELVAGVKQVQVLLAHSRQLVGIAVPNDFREVRTAIGEVAQALAVLESLSVDTWEASLVSLQSASDVHAMRAASSVLEELQALASRLEPLYERLVGPTDSFVSAVNAQLGALNGLREQLVDKEKHASERKGNLAEGGADYPREVKVGLDAFRRELSHIRVQVLCDLIEPVDEGWMPAIEGYLAGSRFNFVVAEEHEEEAIRFVRDRHLKSRVVQGGLCRRSARPDLVPSDSIVHELRTDHPVVLAYLQEQYGQVIKVESFDVLRKTPRGVMKDGRATAGRTYFHATSDNLVFGKAQQAHARAEAEAAHEKAQAELEDLEKKRKSLQALLSQVRQTKRPSFAATSAAVEAVNELGRVADELGRLDLTEVASLAAELNALQTQLEECEGRISRTDQAIGKLNSDLETQGQVVSQKESVLPARRVRVAEEMQRLSLLAEVSGTLSYATLGEQVTQLLESDGGPKNLVDAAQNLIGNAKDFTGDVRELVAEYNQHARQDEKLDFAYGAHRDGDFGPVYGLLIQLRAQVREQLGAQREIGLLKNLDKLQRAETSFQDVFTKQFCYEIRNAVDTGVRTLKALNYELDKLKFGTDRFRIDWSHWVPEFEEYYRFFSAAYELAETQESGGLFDEQVLSPENCAVRDRLLKLLLADDQERAQKELQRIADYRNYRRYEIWKESDSGSRVALSEWGTGSGGQLETPAYIVRAAVVTNRLKHFEKGGNLRLLVNDESFAKMDERRAHDVMKFIRDSLGMQLICAMPTKHAGALKSEFTKEWCFTRTMAEGNGEVDFVSEADERELNSDKLRELWEARRKEVRQQAQLLFEAEEAKEPT